MEKLDPGANLTGTGLRRKCLFQLDGHEMGALGDDDRAALRKWIEAHGLDPKRVSTSAPLLIYREPDGSRYVTCRVMDDPPRACEGCGCCVRSDAVWVPWNDVRPPIRQGWRAPLWSFLK